MQAAFDYQPHPPNCAFRVYDVDRSGRARHVAAEAGRRKLVTWLLRIYSRGTFPILSKEPSFQKTSRNTGGKQQVVEKNDD